MIDLLVTAWVAGYLCIQITMHEWSHAIANRLFGYRSEISVNRATIWGIRTPIETSGHCQAIKDRSDRPTRAHDVVVGLAPIVPAALAFLPVGGALLLESGDHSVIGAIWIVWIAAFGPSGPDIDTVVAAILDEPFIEDDIEIERHLAAEGSA